MYSLEPQARGRLNALLFTGVFIGMAVGSAAGSKLYTLVALATVTGGFALVIRVAESARLARAQVSDAG